MKKAISYWLFPLASVIPSFAQNASKPFPKNLYQNIFNIYSQEQNSFHGVFDSTESVFYVHCGLVQQSQFDSNCLLSYGKAWHRGQLTTFTTYLTIDTVTQVFEVTDSNAENEHWAVRSKVMKTPGTSLWKCEGEFSMNENPDEKFSGKFMGTFTIYFYFSAKKGTLQTLDHVAGFGLEPGMAFFGFWKSYSKMPANSIAFFFANTQPEAREDGALKLPDLRFQADGSSSFSNIVIFPPGVIKPGENWFQ